MPSVLLSSGKGERAWRDGDKFTALILNYVPHESGEGKVLSFVGVKGEAFERNATTLWRRLMEGERRKLNGKVMETKPVLKLGAVVAVEALAETKTGKKGNRFRPFVIKLLTGKDVPKSLRT